MVPHSTQAGVVELRCETVERQCQESHQWNRGMQNA